MSREDSKGIAVSAVVHGLLLGSIVLFSGVAGNESSEEDHERKGTVINVKMAGPGLAGIKGKMPGLADGTSAGDINKSGSKPLFDSEKANRELANALKKIDQRERDAAREQARQQQIAQQLAKENDKSKTKVAGSSGKSDKMYLSDWQKKNGGKTIETASGKTTGGKTGSRSETGGKPRSISGSSVGTDGIVGVGSSSGDGDGGGYGVRGGTGGNGGEGGGGMTAEMYRDNIIDRLAAELKILLNDEGAGLDPTISGRCRINVSANGNISFGGWVNDPGSPLFESLLRRAIDRAGNCGSRPAKMPAMFEQRVTANQQ